MGNITLQKGPHEDKVKVLLIEDDRTMRRIVRSKIADHCELVEAENAMHGLSMYSDQKPDLIFIDIGLPDGSGQNLLEWLVHTDPDTFAVMFSGNSETENVWNSIEAGAKGFIAKPFDLSKMLYFIRQCKDKT